MKQAEREESVSDSETNLCEERSVLHLERSRRAKKFKSDTCMESEKPHNNKQALIAFYINPVALISSLMEINCIQLHFNIF